MKRRIIATILSIALILTSVPWTALDVFAQTTLDVVAGSKVSDPDTTDDWERYFGENSGNVSTQYAGGVWTDKSVFAGDKTLDGVSFTADEDNFLVATSAISSTKQITGYSYLPTDTVLVLDTSGSMTDDDLRAMVQAANAAITKLYETSNYNRVGIAVYNLNSYTLMPIDRYTKTGASWLEFRKNNGTRYIDVAEGVKRSDGTTYTATVTGRSGTYTQGGMQEGLSLFLDVEDTVIETGNIQGGTIRIPVMVLMTDGDPTSGSTIYHNTTNDNRDIGKNNYSTTNAELVFLTQLTAANVHNQMEAHYGRECLFYTLGLGVSGEYAPQMLQPESTGTDTADKIDEYWESYATKQNYEAQGANAANCFIAQYSGRTETVNIYRRTTAEAGQALIDSRYYTDGYFTANNSQGLITAFDDIVKEIILQSKYYPTLVTTGQYDMDGYLTIVDELGEYMEVKNIKGLLYNNTLFSGQRLLEAMYDGTYGNRDTWTALGWELVYSIKERLDVAATGDNTDAGDTTEYGTPIELTNGVVTNLLSQAWADGQISAEFDGNNMTSFSNYVSYYVNAKGQYLGFHDKDHTENDYPVGTKYIGRSYIFSGNITGDTSSIRDTEMMHIVVQVYEDIIDGNQTVTWRIPASLIPTVMYEVSVNGDQLTETTVDEIKYTGDTPIRLVYEVGLNDELTPVNIVEKLTAEGAHAHPTADGGYYFYSNRWGDGHGVTELDPNNHKATVAHFSPSVENERYYYTEDTILYINVNGSYVPYTGAARPADMYPNDNTTSGFFHPVKVVTGTSSSTGADATLTTTWLPVAASVLNDANVTKQTTDGTNQWYVAKGTIYQQTARDRVEKVQNTTETLEYVDYPVIAHPAGEEDAYEVFLFHGNNGRLKVMPATGIKITKEVAEVSQVTGADHNFTFVVDFDKTPAALKVTDAAYNDVAYTTVDSDTIEVTLKKGETVYITGLADGTAYTVTEKSNIYYTIQSVAAETVTDNIAKGVATASVIDAVEFVNTAASFKGDLQISKTVTHPYGDSYVIPANKLFDVTVQFATTDPNVDITEVDFAAAGTVNGGTAIDKVTTDANGKVTLKLAHEDSVTIKGLTHGVTYTVAEPDLETANPGFVNTSSTGLAGTIVTDQTAYAHLVNSYTPVEYPKSTDVDLVITKLLGGKNDEGNDLTWNDITPGSKFEFLLEKYEPTTGAWVDTGRKLEIIRDEQTLTSNTATETRDGTVEPVTFSYVGTHYYRVSEKTGTISGITYDATHAYFRIIVTDDNMDGYPEYTVEAANNTTLDVFKDADDNITGYQVNAQFTNRYNSTTANISIHKNLTNNTGVNVPMDEFSFELLDSSNAPVNDANGNPVVVKPNVNGDVIIPLTYTKDDVTGTASVATTYGDLDDSVAYVETSETEATRTGTVTATEISTKELVETYYLREITGSMPGMSYDSEPVEVTVTVTARETVTYDVTKVVNYTRSKLPVYEQKMENGVPVVDEHGNPVYVQKTENGVPVVDEHDNPVYVQKTENGEPVWTYTEWVQNGEPTVTGTKPSTATPVVTLESAVKYNNDAALTAAQFDNTYTLAPVKAAISGEKTYNRNDAATQFTFNLYETDSTFTVAPNAAALKTATVGAAAATNTFSFAEIEYKSAGTYYYVVTEAIPAEATAQNNYTVNGITYDTTVYHVTVTVSRNTEAGHEDELVASTAVNQVGGSGTTIAFTNSYSITSGTNAVLSIYKALDGRALNKDEFTFNLYNKADYDANGTAAAVLQTAKNSAYNTVNGNKYTGTVSFEAIPYTEPGTYEYAIVEEIPADAVNNFKNGVTYASAPVYATVVVKDNGNGTLAVESITYNNASATIENIYTTTPVTATITGKKFYADNTTNAAKTENETFTFALFEADENYNPQSASCEEIQVTSNTGEFNFTLSRNFTKAGDYYFVLKELTGTNPTIAYDTKTYNVSVIVRDNGAGALTAVTRIFYNGTDVTGPDASNSFNTQYAFTNIYYPQEALTAVYVSKTVENTTGVQLDKDGFRFALYENLDDAKARNDQYIATDLTEADGNAYIGLKFTDTDVPNHIQTDKTYYLVEMYADRNDDFTPDVIGGMQYDQSIYQVSVVVKYVNSALQAEVTGIQKLDSNDMPTGQVSNKAEYTNIYDLTEAPFSITAEKNLTGRNLADGEFRFALYNATVNSQGVWEKGTQVGNSVGNTGNTVTFREHTYSRVGEYYYIAEEVIPAEADKLKGVEYDAAQFRIVVTVTDNGQGALVAEVTDITEVNGTTETDVDKVVFNNTFTPDPIEITISGEKKLNNREPLSGEFEFAIYAADEDYNIVGNALATTTNAADGTFTFTNAMVGGDLLKFTDSATRKFVVKEVVPSPKDPTITYSTFEHNVEVKVTKRADGQLIYSVTDPTGTSADLIIENTYTPKSATAQIGLEKTLVNETGVNPGVSVKDFTFGLYTNEACTVPYTRNGHHVTVSPDDNGNFDSAVINIPYTDASYNAATTYTYYLKEIIPTAADRVPMMQYDNSVYKVVVTLSYDADNNLSAVPVITKVRNADGTAIVPADQKVAATASFNNVYDLGSVSIDLEGTKVYEGWTNNPDETFTFELYQTGVSGNYAATGSQKIATAEVSKAAPKATFTSAAIPQLSFTKAGTYYFAVRENQGGLTVIDSVNGHGIIYSGTQYVVEVKVSENVVGGKVTGLKAEKYVYHYGNRPDSFEGYVSDNIRFTNIDLDGKATIDFIGKKDISNANMADYDQAFDFVLYEAEVNGNTWTLVDSKPDTTAVDPMLSTENREKAEQQENDGYNIEFIGVPLEYAGDGSHTYHFVVKELDGGHPTIGYDAAEYKITVTAAFTTTGTGEHNYTVTSVVVNGENVSFTTVKENTVVLLKNGSEYAFENTYTSYNAQATIPVEKSLSNTTGVGMNEAGFVFGLYTDADCTVPYEVNGEHVTATTGADGKAGITVNFTDKDASVLPHVYYIKEMHADKNNDGVADTIPGMTYSSQVYKVEITVAFDTTGAAPVLKATPVISTVDAASGVAAQLVVNRAEFENTYKLDPATLIGFTGKKVIDTRVINSYEYRFELYEAALTVPGNTVVTDANGAWVKGDRIEEVANTAQSGANAKDYDKFTFSNLTFDKVGVYHYILVEQKGANSSIIYDKNAYQITVTVAPHDTEDELVATVTNVERVEYSYDTGYLDSEMVFEGIFDKDSQNNDLTEDDFVFTNIYRPLGTFTVGGEKAIENRDWKQGDSFTFEIYYAEDDGTLIDAYKLKDGINPMLSETVTYNAQGEYSFSFRDVIVSYIGVDADKNPQIGTQYFVIKEKADNTLPSMSYDETAYLIQVDKKDNGDGTLAVGKYDGTTFTENEFVITKLDANGTSLGAAAAIEFVNKYNTVMTIPATAVIKGEKVLENANISDNQFTFELYRADSNWTIDTAINPVTAKNTGNSFEFNNAEFLTFNAAGTYYFVVKEQKGSNAAIKYDDTEYKVEIVVEDTGNKDANGNAILEVTGTTVHSFNGEIKFTNSYNPAELKIDIIKSLTLKNGAKHSLSGFEFTVYDVVNDQAYPVISDEDGVQTVTFKFNENHLGANNSPKVYTFKITEVNAGKEGMKYDDTEYVIEVTVYAEDGQIKTRVTQQGTDIGVTDYTSVQFNNTYKGPKVPDPEPGTPVVIVPDTGDTNNNMLYISLMAISAVLAGVIFFITRKRKDEEAEA